LGYAVFHPRYILLIVHLFVFFDNAILESLRIPPIYHDMFLFRTIYIVYNTFYQIQRILYLHNVGQANTSTNKQNIENIENYSLMII
jgi:hypothetical protein